MQRRLSRGLPLLVFLGGCLVGFVQTAHSQEASKLPAASAAAETQQKNIQQYIELLRSNVRQQKSEIMGSVMQLDADQAAKFWPLYNEYDKELASLNNLRSENIKEYARNYEAMTDPEADALMRKALDYRRQRMQLLAKYYDQVRTALGGIQAARFIQIENQLLELIDLQIESSLPIVGQERSAEGK
jgi:esterase/lipase